MTTYESNSNTMKNAQKANKNYTDGPCTLTYNYYNSTRLQKNMYHNNMTSADYRRM